MPLASSRPSVLIKSTIHQNAQLAPQATQSEFLWGIHDVLWNLDNNILTETPASRALQNAHHQIEGLQSAIAKRLGFMGADQIIGGDDSSKYFGLPKWGWAGIAGLLLGGLVCAGSRK